MCMENRSQREKMRSKIDRFARCRRVTARARSGDETSQARRIRQAAKRLSVAGSQSWNFHDLAILLQERIVVAHRVVNVTISPTSEACWSHTCLSLKLYGRVPYDYSERCRNAIMCNSSRRYKNGFKGSGRRFETWATSRGLRSAKRDHCTKPRCKISVVESISWA